MPGTGPLELNFQEESEENLTDLTDLSDREIEKIARTLIEETPTLRTLKQHRIFEAMRERGLPPPYDAPTRPARNKQGFVWDENDNLWVINSASGNDNQGLADTNLES